MLWGGDTRARLCRDWDAMLQGSEEGKGANKLKLTNDFCRMLLCLD
jgi:hypothetical protein